MISTEQVLKIHANLIKKFGGLEGLKDTGNLEAALAKPFQTFDGQELYPTAFDKAAAIGESIIINHPFMDGNKRTGYVLMEALLRHQGYKIFAADQKIYEFVISISTGQISFDQIV